MPDNSKKYFTKMNFFNGTISLITILLLLSFCTKEKSYPAGKTSGPVNASSDPQHLPLAEKLLNKPVNPYSIKIRTDYYYGLRKKYSKSFSGKEFAKVVNFNIDTAYKNPKAYFIDSIFLFFECGFNNSFVEVFANHNRIKSGIYTTDESLGLARDFFIGKKSTFKNISFKINNSQECSIDLDGSEPKILQINLRRDSIIFTFANKPREYM